MSIRTPFVAALVISSLLSGLPSAEAARYGGRIRARHAFVHDPQFVSEAASQERISELLGQGDALLKNKNFDAAIAAFGEAIELDPTCAKAYCGRGRGNVEKDECDAAITDLTEAIRLDPGLVVAHVQRGRAYGKSDRYDEGIADLVEAIRLEPSDSDTWAVRGALYGQKGDLDKAIADATEAIRLDPRSDYAYGLRGAVYINKECLAAAIADLDAAIRLNPSNDNALSNRGGAYALKGDYKKAIADIDAAIRINPKNATRYHNRSEAYRMAGDLEKAIADSAEAIGLAPRDPDYRLQHARCLTGRERWSEAIADLDAAIKLRPRDPCLYEIRGALFVRRKDYQRAIADFQTMMRLNPADPAARFDQQPKTPLFANALRHGEQQVRQMLHDRPAMAMYGEKAAVLRQWAARKFAGEDLHEQIAWDPHEPEPAFPAENQPPLHGQKAAIRMRANWDEGASEDARFERFWNGAVFELYNISSTEDFARAEREAAAGGLSRREFCVKVMEVESRACEKCRAFYINVFLPWARDHGVATHPRVWDVAKRSNIGENLFLADIDDEDPHWPHYGHLYDQIIATAVAEKRTDSEATELATKIALANVKTAEDKAVVHFAVGYRHMMQNDFGLAIASLNDAIRLDPKNAAAQYSRACAYVSRYCAAIGDANAKPITADLDEAIADASIAMQRDECEARCVRAAARCLKGDLDGAVTDFHAVANRQPELAAKAKLWLVEICFALAKAHGADQQYNRAIADCTAALRFDPSNAVAYDARGYFYLQKEHYAKAIADLNEAIRLSPERATSRCSRAAAHLKQGNCDKAIADFIAVTRLNRALAGELEPRLGEAYWRRGQAHVAKHEWDKAIADLTEARRLTPLVPPGLWSAAAAKPATDKAAASDNAAAGRLAPAFFHLSNGSIESQAQKPQTAQQRQVDTLPPINDVTPELINAYLERAAERRGKENLKGAIADLSEALRLDPKQTVVRSDRAALYRRIGDYKKAVEDSTEILRIDPRSLDARLNRGLCRLDAGETDAAIADFTAAIQLSRYAPPAGYCHRAEAFLKKGDPAAALRDVDAAIRISPRYAAAYECRARIRQRMGELDKAEQDFAMAKRLGHPAK